jgi:hypothetical protein
VVASFVPPAVLSLATDRAALVHQKAFSKLGAMGSHSLFEFCPCFGSAHFRGEHGQIKSVKFWAWIVNALCELINVLHDACLPRRSHIKISKMKMGAPMMNLPAFVEAARNLGVEDRDCFAPPDLTDDAWWALWSRQLLC